MPWPETEDPARYDGLRERVLKLRSETDYALFGMAPSGHDLFNQLFRVRGMVNGMNDLLLEQDFAEAFFDRLTATIMRNQELFLDEVGDLIDVHFTTDDLSGQTAPLVSPEIYRRLIKPRWAKIISLIRSKTKAKVLYHTWWAVDEFIRDPIEIGGDILNPVQVAAPGMDSAELKRKYGDGLSFWSGGCDTQRVLPFGTPDEVRAEVKRRISDFAAVGGFLFGYDLAIISGAMIFLKKEFHLNPTQLGFATASALIGCMLGHCRVFPLIQRRAAVDVRLELRSGRAIADRAGVFSRKPPLDGAEGPPPGGGDGGDIGVAGIPRGRLLGAAKVGDARCSLHRLCSGNPAADHGSEHSSLVCSHDLPEGRLSFGFGCHRHSLVVQGWNLLCTIAALFLVDYVGTRWEWLRSACGYRASWLPSISR